MRSPVVTGGKLVGETDPACRAPLACVDPDGEYLHIQCAGGRFVIAGIQLAGRKDNGSYPAPQSPWFRPEN